ncbi:hypothetical protein ACQKP8_26530 [Photobacterium alginatilyticum]|uniref:hypothetical protein n=1 Tax=Photobacterium alginatilyticum TaxID=1775171 RepID=UPI004069086B
MTNIERGYLGFYWHDRAQTLGDYLSFCSRFFEVLGGNAQLSDITLATEGGNIAVRIPIIGPDLFELGGKIVSPKVKYDYKEGGADITFVKSPLGFTSSWVFSLASGESGTVTISSGSYGDVSPGNSIVLKFSDWNSLVSRDELEKIWIDTILLSECDFAAFTSKDLNQEIDPEFQYDFSVGWLSYVARHEGIDLKKLPASIYAEDAANGLILKTSKDKLCSFDKGTLNELKNAQELLVDSGVIDTDDF